MVQELLVHQPHVAILTRPPLLPVCPWIQGAPFCVRGLFAFAAEGTGFHNLVQSLQYLTDFSRAPTADEAFALLLLPVVIPLLAVEHLDAIRTPAFCAFDTIEASRRATLVAAI